MNWSVGFRSARRNNVGGSNPLRTGSIQRHSERSPLATSYLTSNQSVQLQMKTSESISLGSAVPSLFQIAALFDDFFPPEGIRQSASALSHLPIAEYMLNPEKLMNLLRTPKASAAPAPSAKARVTVKRAAGTKRKAGAATAGEPDGLEANGLDFVLPKKIEFLFPAPGATSVKLAGDFTEWDAHAIDMMCSDDGTWFTVVPLTPGSYSYRFIVDGEWCDDPRASRHIRNPFGSENAIIQVT